ncbi:MAG: hypothetical protein IKW00_09960 [Clostridia bacterium]|nr:hypothetical protein [Clostridia bacterium]
MKRIIITLLILCCSASLTACTRDTTVTPSASPSVSPSAAVSNTPDLPMILPEDSAMPAQGDPSLKDGEYHTEVSDEYAQSQGHGWKEYLKMTVSNGVVSDVEYDALKGDKRKSMATGEDYPMTPHPSEWIPQINDALRSAKTPESMDTVSGATMSSEIARKLYAAALEAARSGNTGTVIIE